MEDKIIYQGKGFEEQHPYGFSGEMRVKAIKLVNFKAFQDSGWINFNRIILLIGKNSIGKSSITQALQMIGICYDNYKQGRIQPGILSLEDAFGSFDDIKNHRGKSNSYSILLLLDGEESDYYYNVTVSEIEKKEQIRITISDDSSRVLVEKTDSDVENIFFARTSEEDVRLGIAPLILAAVNAVKAFASEIEYISPIRTTPRRNYIVSGTLASAVGINGDNAYDMLFYLSQIKQDVPLPIVKWLKMFGYELIWRAQGDNKNQGAFWLKNIKTGDLTNVVDNGFGISQSLPVVLAMSMKKKGLLIVDTPEAHLQAPIESMFADIINMTVNPNISFMMETGSEQILMRVRKHIADGMISADDVSCFFIDESQGDCGASCKKLSILQNGMIEADGSSFAFFFSGVAEDLMEIKKLQFDKVRKRIDEKNCN